VSDDPALSELLTRARHLVEDLNMTTMGWQMPSDRLIDDFAAGEHRLHAVEHELTDIDRAGSRTTSRRAFSLYPPDAAPGQGEPLALLIEPSGAGSWRLLVADTPGAGRGRRQ
jgi:hypothetical protein